MRSDSSCSKAQVAEQGALLQYRLTYRDLTYFTATKIEIPTRSPDLRGDLYGTVNTKGKKSVKTVKTALNRHPKLGSSA
jgi:hypothetical protein